MTLNDFVEKMLKDEKFREAVKNDPKQALTTAGATPTEAQVKALRHINFHSLNRVSEAFGSKAVT